MSSRGVLVSNDSMESVDDFPIIERPLTPRTPKSPLPKSPKSPLPMNARDYFSLHRGNVN